MSSDWPFQGEEFVRLDLGDGFDLVIEDDGDEDAYIRAMVTDPNGNPHNVRTGLRRLRKWIGDDREFARRMELLFADDSEDDPFDDVHTGPPPISTLPVTYRCAECETFCVRTTLTNPRDPEDRWTCEDCAGNSSAYPGW